MTLTIPGPPTTSRRDNRNDPLSGGSSWGTQGLILAETFERHWLQLREIAAHNVSQNLSSGFGRKRDGDEGRAVHKGTILGDNQRVFFLFGDFSPILSSESPKFLS